MNTRIIKNPRITEKASLCAGQNVYTFDIVNTANKAEIKKAIFELYKVRPEKINILPVPQKKVLSRGSIGTKGGGKKAMIYLKEGDKIDFV